MVTIDQKRVIQDILGAFETGHVGGDYGAVTILRDGAGVSYGKHQSTDRSGSLDQIVIRYSDLGGARADELLQYLPRLEQNATTSVDPDAIPRWVSELMALLTSVGETDSIMHLAQDQIFDEEYWRPAADQAEAMKLVLPLSWLVVYDTTIQSGPGGVSIMRKHFAALPPSRGGDERMWVSAYLKARREWLFSSKNQAVRRSVYRVDSMLDLVQRGCWQLQTPLKLLLPAVTVP